jgi:hypothetical protein
MVLDRVAIRDRRDRSPARFAAQQPTNDGRRSAGETPPLARSSNHPYKGDHPDID